MAQLPKPFQKIEISILQKGAIFGDDEIINRCQFRENQAIVISQNAIIYEVH